MDSALANLVEAAKGLSAQLGPARHPSDPPISALTSAIIRVINAQTLTLVAIVSRDMSPGHREAIQAMFEENTK